MGERTYQRLAWVRPSVFEETNALAARTGAVNLGSGTPDVPVPERMRQAVAEAMARGRNQYTPVHGAGVLRQAVAAHAARFYGQAVDPEAEVSITCGVTEGVFAALFSLTEPGDEVVLFDPCYDCYAPAIRMAGGVPVPVPLYAPAFRFDPHELTRAFSSRTRAVLVNTPHNPTGTVFSRAELELIADLCRHHDALAITDEVYEHVVFDGAEHVRLATLPGMRDRTLTLSGAGKTFSCTGWRIGWAVGPAVFQETLRRLRQFTVFAAPTPLQWGVAVGFDLPDDYFRELARDYQLRRDVLVRALAGCGLTPNRPAGSFFVLTEVPAGTSARGFCNRLAETVGVVPVPTDTFYLNAELGERFVRFAFSGPPARLEDAAVRLASGVRP